MRNACTLIFFLLPASLPAQIVPFASSNLPIIVIETNGVIIDNEPRSPAFMTVFDTVQGRNRLAGQQAALKTHIGIEIAGHSTLIFPKKQFRIELSDNDGNDSDAALLGMPAEEDWRLSAPYSDKSLIRNVLGLHLFSSAGRYASRTRFFELVIDGSYRGVYVLLEHIKRGRDRINIARLDPDENDSLDVTGGYIFKMDPGDMVPFEGWSASFDSLGYFSYLYHYPDRREITAFQRAYIVGWFERFEEVMRAEPRADSAQGYRRLVDVASFIDYFLVQELSNNCDAYAQSTYFYKDRDDRDPRLHIGPPWDLHSAFGNCNYGDGGQPRGWRLHRQHRPFWWYTLLADPAFLRDTKTRWRALRAGAWSTDALFGFVDSLAVLLAEAQERNFRKWNILGRWITPNSYVGLSYPDEITFLKSYLRERLEWIDANIEGLSPTVEYPSLPARCEITHFYPNPVSSEATLHYVLPNWADVDLFIVDAMGRRMTTLYSGFTAPGEHLQHADLRGFGNGVYCVRLSLAGAPADSRFFIVQ